MLPSSSARKKFLPLGLLASLFLTGCEVFTNANQSTFDPKGPVAQEQLDLFMITLWVIAFIFVAVASVLLYAVVRFRARPGQQEVPHQSHGNPILEVSLIVASVALLVIVAVPTIKVAVFSYDVPAEAEDEVLEITATGFQWWWSFDYHEEGVTTANELVLPKDRYVRIHVRSQDVIHSFWIPKLGGKRDMIPNRDNFLWLKADETGEYFGQCAEYCGTSHANMLFRVYVMEENEYDDWIQMKSRPSPAPPEEDQLALEGRNLFQNKGCVQCHNIEGIGGGVLGPDLSHFGTRHTVAAALLENTPENLALWIRDPERVKPGNLMDSAVKQQNLQEEEIERLVAFLRSQK